MKLIILDRDGVINHDSDEYIKSVDEWIPLPGSIEAVARLSRAGYTVAIATNQSGIGRKLLDEEELSAMHDLLCFLVEEAGGSVNGIFFCPHLPEDACACRKPAIGLFRQIEEEFGIPVQNAPFVGDSVTDIAAARAAGCSPVLVRTGKGLRTLTKACAAELEGVPVYDDLDAYVNDLLEPAVPQ